MRIVGKRQGKQEINHRKKQREAEEGIKEVVRGGGLEPPRPKDTNT